MDYVLSIPQKIGDLLRQQFVLRKLNTPTGWILLIGISLLLGWAMAMTGTKGSLAILGGIIGGPMLLYCFLDLRFGVALTLVTAFLIGLISKYTYQPIGIALDLFLFILSFSLIVRLSQERDFRYFKHPISLFILAWIYYNIFQVLNPNAESRMAWLYTVRSLAVLHFLFFITCYAFKDLKSTLNMIKIILALGLISALYGLKQEFIGFTSREIAWLYEDEERFQLIVQWDRFRIFSFFSDPTTYGILMAYMGNFCFILATGPFAIWKRLVLVFSGICMFLAMAYAGSRTPIVLVPIGMIFFVLMNPRKEILIGAAMFFMMGTLMVFKSSSSAVIFRLQSAFRPGDDASVMVRINNQKRIQPFIKEHPIGAGLGSTGAWGKRFTPDSWLASFAHDSGFVRIAVEMGWIGLILYMSMLFVIAKTSIYHFFRVRDPVIKVMYLGLSNMILMLIVASYPQEAIVILPTSIIFYVSLAAIIRLKDFDRPQELSSAHE